MKQLPSPCFVVDEGKIIENLSILKGVMDRTGCKILLAQKAFSLFALYPLIGEYLCGTTASGLYEARLAREEMNGENHIFCPGYREEDFGEIAELCDHIVFNSFSQFRRFAPLAKEKGKSVGIRINPEHSTQENQDIYNPCAPLSRLGVTRQNFQEAYLDQVDGLHFHTLCEQDSDALVKTVAAIEDSFGPFLHRMKWLNFGGGHHITREGYDLSALESCIRRVQDTYGLQVYLEPGEAVALNAGTLETTVLDLMENGMPIAILDTSAACHMPDVLEMPYRPPLRGSGLPGEKLHTYRLGGMTCLAGDIIGDYSFDKALEIGDQLVFDDMAIYSMVKTNTFNGMALPAIAIRDRQGGCRVIRSFGYEDFKGRLS